MNGNKTFFILPGFRMQVTDKPYKWLIAYLENNGIRVLKVPVAWNNKTLSQNAAEFVEYFNAHKSKENYILGFSYGAVLALITANLLRPKKIYLCSVSPDFSEDRASMTPWMKRYIGKKRFADTATRNGRKLAKQLLVPSVILYGEKEGKDYLSLKKRCEETVHLAKRSRLVVVKDAPHAIDHPEYREAIIKALSL